MSLRDGVSVNSYSELESITHAAFFHEAATGRNFSYNVRYDCPGMINIETGERFFSEDIKRFIKFPLHCIRLAPFTQEEMDAP